MKTVKKVMWNFAEIITSRLANKMILVFSLVIFMLVITLTYISYNNTKEILKEDFISNSKNVLKLVNQEFESYVKQFDDLSLNFRNDAQFMNILLTKLDDYGSVTYLENQIKNLFYSRNDIEALRFYIPENKKMYSISRSLGNLRGEYNESVTKQDWYLKTVKGKYYRYIHSPNSGNKEELTDGGSKVFLTFNRDLINIQDKRPLGLISISLNFDIINRIIGDVTNKSDDMFGIFDKDNVPFYYTNQKLLEFQKSSNFFSNIDDKRPNGDFVYRDGKQTYLVIYDISNNYSWKSVKLLNLDTLNKSAQRTRNINFLIGGVFLLLFIIIVMFISNAITGSLRKLSRQMVKVGDGNLEARTEIKGNDEIARLSIKFNSMITKIDNLINEEYKSKLSERNARLKALEAQINPHFLYNSLQAISTKALTYGMRDVSRMVEALAYTLRYTIKGGDMVPVSTEIEHINNYIILQKGRFGERLSLRFDIDEKLFFDITIPKLSIQTLVENSIKHGLEQMTGCLLIVIRTHIEDGKVVITVSDNGLGMSSERREQIKQELNDNSWMEHQNDSIGLKNLNARLKLLYGSEAFLEIDSGDGGGTEVKIIFPHKVKGDTSNV